MKHVILMLVFVASMVAMSACSKNSGNGGNYANTPGGTNCSNGAYPGMNYQQGYNQGYIQNGQYLGQYPNQYPNQYGNQYYPNQYGQPNVNCIPSNYINSGNPYFFQANYQVYLGTCDLRFSGRGQLCPTGYQCRPAFGAMGMCMRAY